MFSICHFVFWGEEFYKKIYLDHKSDQQICLCQKVMTSTIFNFTLLLCCKQYFFIVIPMGAALIHDTIEFTECTILIVQSHNMFFHT